VGNHKIAQQSDIIEKAARFGRGRNPPQPGDDLGLAH